MNGNNSNRHPKAFVRSFLRQFLQNTFLSFRKIQQSLSLWKNRQHSPIQRSKIHRLLYCATGCFIATTIAYSSANAASPIVQDLNAKVNQLDASLTLISSQTLKLSKSVSVLVNNRVTPQTIYVGDLSGKKGATINLPVLLNAGPIGVSTIQFDLILPPGISSGTITAGASSTNAGKNIQGSPIPGGIRVLIFGLNQNLMASGVVANAALKVSATAVVGYTPVRIANIVGSDPNGINANVSGANGSIVVN